MMVEYIIERDILSTSDLAKCDLKSVARRSHGALRELGTDIQWVHSYVSKDKIYCIYRAMNEDLIRQHAWLAAIPATSVARVDAVINSTTAE